MPNPAAIRPSVSRRIDGRIKCSTAMMRAVMPKTEFRNSVVASARDLQSRVCRPRRDPEQGHYGNRGCTATNAAVMVLLRNAGVMRAVLPRRCPRGRCRIERSTTPSRGKSLQRQDQCQQQGELHRWSPKRSHGRQNIPQAGKNAREPCPSRFRGLHFGPGPTTARVTCVHCKS